MSYLLFFLWLIFLSRALGKIKFIQRANLEYKFIVLIFLTKVAAGMAMGVITHTLNSRVDTWAFHFDGLVEYHLLFSNPKEYFFNLFHSIYPDQYGGVFSTSNSYWNDLRNNIMFKIVSILHLFSFGNYYINVVLFNFITFFGDVALYRFLKTTYPGLKRLPVICSFLLPSMLLYSSTLQKDGIVLAAIGAILYCTWQILAGRWKLNFLLLIGFGFIFLFLFRNLVAIALLPALAALVLCYKLPFKPLVVFTALYSIGVSLFFILPMISPALNFPGFIAQRQLDFLSLNPANTLVSINPLQPSFASFAVNAPQALWHSLGRPTFFDGKLSLMLLPFALEATVYATLIMMYFVSGKQRRSFNQPIIIFGFFFSISICLVIGYTVPILGAVIRYRAIYLPFLMGPFICCTDWRRIKKIFNISK